MDLSRSIAFQRSRLFPICCLAMASACLMLPVWLFGFPANGDDAHVHIRWQTLFAQQFWSGEWYPRWLGAMNQGLGSPAFFIYPPLSHIVAALPAPLSDGQLWVRQRIGIGATLGFFISGVGAYLWLHRLTASRAGALAGALVFLLAPYHLFLDTYYRAAYAELWGFAWAPFSLLAIHWFEKTPARAVVLYSLSCAALFFSHAPSCIAFPPLYLAYAALLAVRARRPDILYWTLASTACAALLAGVYLATALAHQANIDTGALYTGYFDFFRWFLLSRREWPEEDFEMAIGGVSLPQFTAVLVLGGLMLGSRRIDAATRTLVIAGIAGSLFILFMMLPLSAPLWSVLALARKIQFPWRLLAAQSVLLALVCALYARWAQQCRQQGSRALRHRLLGPLLTCLLAANAAAILHGGPYFGPTRPGPLEVSEYQMGPVEESAALFAGDATLTLLSGQGSLRLETVSARHLRIHVDAATEMSFALRQFMYPRWHCTPGGTLAACTVLPFSTRLPVVTLRTGPGSGQLDLVLIESRSEKNGRLISLAGMLMLAGLVGLALLRQRRQRRMAPGTPAPQPLALTK